MYGSRRGCGGLQLDGVELDYYGGLKGCKMPRHVISDAPLTI